MGSRNTINRGPGGNAQNNPGGMVGSRNVASMEIAAPPPALGTASWNRPTTQRTTFQQPGFNVQQPTMGIPLGTAAQMPGGMFPGNSRINAATPQVSQMGTNGGGFPSVQADMSGLRDYMSPATAIGSNPAQMPQPTPQMPNVGSFGGVDLAALNDYISNLQMTPAAAACTGTNTGTGTDAQRLPRGLQSQSR